MSHTVYSREFSQSNTKSFQGNLDYMQFLHHMLTFESPREILLYCTHGIYIPVVWFLVTNIVPQTWCFGPTEIYSLTFMEVRVHT